MQAEIEQAEQAQRDTFTVQREYAIVKEVIHPALFSSDCE